MQAKIMKLLVLTSLIWLVLPAQAQQSEMFGPYELHYSVVNTTFITGQATFYRCCWTYI